MQANVIKDSNFCHITQKSLRFSSPRNLLARLQPIPAGVSNLKEKAKFLLAPLIKLITVPSLINLISCPSQTRNPASAPTPAGFG